jgi:hypothetical protein
MSTANSIRQRATKSNPTNEREILRTLIEDLEGIERLQQMQGQLLREVIREVKKLKRA